MERKTEHLKFLSWMAGKFQEREKRHTQKQKQRREYEDVHHGIVYKEGEWKQPERPSIGATLWKIPSVKY